MKWDAYACTIRDTPDRVVKRLSSLWESADFLPARGSTFGYERAGEFRLPTGEVLARVLYGGNGGGVHVSVQGRETAEAVKCIRGMGVSHTVSRADVCSDFCFPGAWDHFAGMVEGFKESHGVRRRVFDAEEEGATIYMGSPRSVAEVRCYQKGKEMLGVSASPDWVRVEVTIRPGSRDGKELLAGLEPAEVWGCTKWTGALGEMLLGEPVERVKVGTVWRASNEERARAAMVKQYRRVLEGWAEEIGGWQRLGVVLRDACQDEPLLCAMMDEETGNISECY